MPITALLALSVIIALPGTANTLALSIHERTREVGLLRALGMARRQLRSMIRWESAIIPSLGAVLGTAVALFFGWAVVASMRNLGVTELVFPVTQLAALASLTTVAGVLTLVPRSGSTNVIAADRWVGSEPCPFQFVPASFLRSPPPEPAWR